MVGELIEPGAFSEDQVAAISGEEFSKKRRTASLSRFLELGLPSQAEEDWRYSRIEELDLANFRPTVERPSLPASMQFGDGVGVREVINALEILAPRAYVALVRLLSDNGIAALAVTLNGWGVLTTDSSVVAVDHTTFGGGLSQSFGLDSVGELAQAFQPESVTVSLPDGVRMEGAVAVLHLLVDLPDRSGLPGTQGAALAASFPSSRIEVGEGSQVDLVEMFFPIPGSSANDLASLVVAQSEISVGQAANATLTTVQELGPEAWFVCHQASDVAKDASFTSFTVSVGGHYSRFRTDSRLSGTGGETRLLASYIGSDSQMHDFRTLQEHAAPRTHSDLLFKGAVADEAKSVYSGLIRIEKGATKSAAFQTNKNLVLSEGAHADSVPNLDIEENDVKCSHASTVGPVDADQRYYLESRGIPTPVAESLIVEGFFSEMAERSPVGAVEPVIKDKVARLLGQAILPETGSGVSGAAFEDLA